MDKYKRISESLEELSGGQIVQKKRKVIVPILCIIGGLLLMWWGIEKWTEIGYELTCYILVFGGLFIVGWGIVMLTFNTHYYEVKESGEQIKPSVIYLNPSDKELVLDLLNKGDLEGVIKKGIKHKSPLLLELWQADSHKLLYSQLLYNENAHAQPVSEPVITQKK